MQCSFTRDPHNSRDRQQLKDKPVAKMRPTKLLAAAVILATVWLARADDTDHQFKLPEGLFVGSNQATVINADGKPEMITGSNNNIRIKGDCSNLRVFGSNNYVSVEKVGQIEMAGSNNRIEYVSGMDTSQPKITNFGADNEAKQVAALGPGPSPGKDSAESDSSAQVIRGSNAEREEKVQRPRVRLVGSNNEIKLTGTVDELFIDGSNNEIQVDQVGHVYFHGSNNELTYATQPPGGSVKTDDNGANNVVQSGSAR
jgi:hypothetical protein